MPPSKKELPPEKMRYYCDLSQFKFQTTKELKPLAEVIGQDRAVTAIDFGVDIKSFGYNIFVVGPVGAGRTTTVTDAVKKRARQMVEPDDWCYVYNFKDPDKPIAIRLAPGEGRRLAQSMDRIISQLSRDIPEVLSSEEYQQQRRSIIESSQDQENEHLFRLNKRAMEKGFVLKKYASGLILVPIRDGKPLSSQQIDALSPKEKKQLEKVGQALLKELNEELQEIHKLEQETKEKLDRHLRNIMWIAIEHPMNQIRREFRHHEGVLNYLKAVEEDLLNNIETLFPVSDEKKIPSDPEGGEGGDQVSFYRYQVNLLVDNSQTEGAPVVVENNPTYNNLIGRIDRIPQLGTLITDFTMIRAGALHRANGGFLIIEADQLFKAPMAWQAIKRSLKGRSVVITDLSEEYSHVSVKTLEPEPIPLDVKLIIIGNSYTYYTLWAYDEEFRKLFKVKADFSLDMPVTRKNVMSYARYIAKQCEKEGLLHLDTQAVGRVIEYGVELTANQKKISTRLTQIRDLLVEANYWAKRKGHEVIKREDIQLALNEEKYRLNRYEIQLKEMISEGTIFINTTGEKVGEVNGLAVLNIGDYMFGKPTRITARTYLGQSGVIAIDREAKMSGPLHNKGVLILSGYLNGIFGIDKQLSMSASITFEQSYESIDGDSASSTELYALLSCLSGYPIKQGIAVTGSVNQLGEIQPIGGVKFKIEGFFDVCLAKGLTGEQGVLIPQANVKNLVLDERVVDAVRKGKFHIYPVSTVEEGIEILTGRKAGRRRKSGKFPEGTVFRAVDDKLRQMAEQLNEEKKRKSKKTKRSE